MTMIVAPKDRFPDHTRIRNRVDEIERYNLSIWDTLKAEKQTQISVDLTAIAEGVLSAEGTESPYLTNVAHSARKISSFDKAKSKEELQRTIQAIKDALDGMERGWPRPTLLRDPQTGLRHSLTVVPLRGLSTQTCSSWSKPWINNQPLMRGHWQILDQSSRSQEPDYCHRLQYQSMSVICQGRVLQLKIRSQLYEVDALTHMPREMIPLIHSYLCDSHPSYSLYIDLQDVGHATGSDIMINYYRLFCSPPIEYLDGYPYQGTLDRINQDLERVQQQVTGEGYHLTAGEHWIAHDYYRTVAHITMSNQHGSQEMLLVAYPDSNVVHRFMAGTRGRNIICRGVENLPPFPVEGFSVYYQADLDTAYTIQFCANPENNHRPPQRKPIKTFDTGSAAALELLPDDL